MKVLLFDLDGTLMDTLDDITDAVNYAMKEKGFPLHSRQEVRSAVGNGVVSLIGKLLPEGQKDKLEETLAIFRPYYDAHAADKSRPYDGIPALLKQLEEEGYVCGIVSNKPDASVQLIAKEFFPSFPIALGQREGIARKPDAEPILYALQSIGASVKECLYIGDSEVDVTTAANAGVPCIGVTWGFRDKEALTAAGAEHLAHTPAQLADTVHALL